MTMSSSRNKRKRGEADAPPTIAAPQSRRRAREQRGVGTEPTEQPKNEANISSEQDEASNANLGEPSAFAEPSKTPAAQHTNTSSTGASKAPGEKSAGAAESAMDNQNDENDLSGGKNDSQATATKEGGRIKTDPTAEVVSSGKKSENSTNATEKGKSNRANQIRSMISHRKLLLERVRQGRSSARYRVTDLARSEPKSAKTSEPSGGNTASAEVTEKAKDDAEIAAFKRMSRSAAQAAKKQKAADKEKAEAAERRTVSLRRGASVGKKMNAALSSLAPGHGAATGLSTEISATQPLPLSAAGGSMSTIPGPPPPISAQRPSTTSNVRQAIQQPGQNTSGKRMKSSQLSASANQSSLRVPAVSIGDPSFASKGSRSGAQKSVKATAAAPAVRGMSSAAPPNTVALPLHAGIPASGLPPNRLATPPVVCPEAVGLREKRNAIRSKLTAILNDRQEKIQKTQLAFSVSLLGDKSPTDDRPSFFSSFASMKVPGPATYLPRRRKTHWDNLLEEMRWMATDFLEERKWKVSAARTLGCAILTTGTKSATIPADAEVNLSEKPVSSEMPIEMKAVKSTLVADSKPRTLRTYTNPSTEDSTASRKVAKIISSMAYELGSATIDAGALASSDRVHMKALNRHLGMRKKLEKPNGIALKKESDKIDSENSMETQKTEEDYLPGKNASNTEIIENDVNQKIGSFERINKAVEALLEAPQKTARKKRKADSGRKADAEDVTLTSSQLEAIEFIENKWNNGNGPGAIFTGPKSSGKTTALCSLLWKNRGKGPQLLVCSPARVMKWVHELYRFKGLQIRYLGLSGGISSPFSVIEGKVNFESNEIVVCEYSEFKGIAIEDFKHFETMLIDCRYPRGFLGSRLPSVETTESKSREEEPDTPSTAVPMELTKESWWESVTESVAKCSMKRLLVENSGPDMFTTCLVGKSQVQLLEIIALRAAFVMGPQIFASQNSSVKKRILTWARRKTKQLNQSGLNKLETVRNFLIESVRPFYCEARSDGKLEEASHKAGKKLEYEVWLCDLSSEERSEYDKCCAALRGALSFHISTAEENSLVRERTFNAISDAFMRLRRQCVHSNMHSLFQTAEMRLRLASYPIPGAPTTSDSRIICRKVYDNPSQTDVHLACSILKGSAKLRELLSILRNDCGYDFEGEGLLKTLLTAENSRRGKGASERKSPKKVAILAVLPEIQILVSVLLNSIGVSHELLLRPSRMFNPSHDDISANLPERQTNAATLAWIECQQALSRFNTLPSGKNTPSSMISNILVTSPDTVAGDHGGIGIDAADFVISLDEDWSGRGELIMRSMMAGLILRNMRAKDRGCQILRLVCENTCEEMFLSTEPEDEFKETETADVWPWPLDSYGRFVIADPSLWAKNDDIEKWPERQSYDDIFAFPGMNLFRLRNKSLSDVLSADVGLPPLLNSGSQICFLPSNGSELEKRVELHLLVSLMQKEEGAHNDFQNAAIVSQHLSRFHPAAFTRQDLNVVAIRIYLEQFGKSLVLKHLAAGSGSTPSMVPADVILATSADTATAALESTSGLADSLQKGLRCKPEEFVSGLLFYNPVGTLALSKSNAAGLASSESSLSSLRSLSPRINGYVVAFNESKEAILRDGHQGSESLIYFPPLFPGMLQCSIQAKRDIEAIRAQNMSGAGMLTELGSEKKRRAESLEASQAKRQKPETPMATGVHAPSEQYHLPSAPPVATGTPIPHQTSGPGVVSEDETSHSDAASFLLELDEDFGLAGQGAVPLPKDSAVVSSQTFVEVSSLSFDSDLLAFASISKQDLVCDTEELESFRKAYPHGLFSNSIILFVARKKQHPFAPLPGVAAPAYRPPQGFAGPDGPWPSARNKLPPSAPGGGNGVFLDMNGSMHSSKKAKKKGPAPAGASPAQMSMILQSGKAKDLYKNKILSFLTPRQKAMGMTLFESPAYRVAAIRFRNRVNDRMPRHSWMSSAAWKAGPGLPLVLAKDAFFSDYPHGEPNLWTSIVKGLKDGNACTGDDAIALAGSQRAGLRRSLAAPCRVDFGPFSSGFLPAPSGMTGVSPPRSRIGVTLPMGVKVPQGHEGIQQRSWSAEEDERLQRLAVRFGMNWIVAASALSGLDDVVSSDAIPFHHRSPRQCRDRWQVLARGNQSLATEVRNAERENRESAMREPCAVSQCEGPALRLGAPILGTKKTITNMSKKADDGEQHGSSSFLFPSERTPENLAEGKSTTMKADESAEKIPGDGGLEDARPTTSMDIDGSDEKGAVSSQKVKSKKKFGALFNAKARTQVIPITIPGVPPGSQASFSAAHPSHSQTVQSSVAASWTNGKTEMWPLQFLDVAEKQRAAATAAAAGTNVAPASATKSVSRASGAASAVSRPQSSAVASAASSRSSSTHKASATSRSSSSAKSRTPPNPQKSPPAYYPYPHPHPGPMPPQGYPHPHPQHHPYHQHQRPPPASPAARAPPNAASHPNYAVHTPVVHTQQLQAEAAKRRTPPSNPKSVPPSRPGANKAATPGSAATPPQQSPTNRRSPAPRVAPSPAPSPHTPPK